MNGMKPLEHKVGMLSSSAQKIGSAFGNQIAKRLDKCELLSSLISILQAILRIDFHSRIINNLL
jgi:hypothetical protein